MWKAEDYYLHVTFQDKSVELKVRHFSVTEALDEPFHIRIVGLSDNYGINLEDVVGKPASFVVRTGIRDNKKPDRLWTGIVKEFELLQAETEGASTYSVQIVPHYWLLTQRRGHRIFQRKKIDEIIKEILTEWRVEHKFELKDEYLPYDYVVQYDESDFHFINRLLQHEGITYKFVFDGDKSETVLVFDDKPTEFAPRAAALNWEDSPNREIGREYINKLRSSQEIRPGKYTIREYDFLRQPDFRFLESSEPPAMPPEDFYEQYHYVHADSLRRESSGSKTADDKGAMRQNPSRTKKAANVGMQSDRRGRRKLRFATNAVDLAPGIIFNVQGHPRTELSTGQKFMVSRFTLYGGADIEWSFVGEAEYQHYTYRPARTLKKPRIAGLQSAVVTGERGQEIHTDEFGRIRVQFHWDREGRFDDDSSCWVRVSQAWAGAGFGTVMTPRVGQEVLVAFVDGDPDVPVVVGRSYNNANPVPYALPDNSYKSTWRSDSTVKWEGFNEITFEDEPAKELVYIQAQRDMQKLTKREEVERIGNNKALVVGNNRSAVINTVDAKMVGTTFAMTMIDKPSKSDLRIAEQGAPSTSPKDTKIEMRLEQLILTTGKATVAFQKDCVFLDAQGDIQINSEGGDVILEGKTTFINAATPKSAPKVTAWEKVEPLTWTPSSSMRAESVHQQVDAPVGKISVDQAIVPNAPPERRQTNEEIVCRLLGETVKCSHGRSPNERGVLEVVADSITAADTITLEGNYAGGCGNHPLWIIGGTWTSREKKASTSFGARGWGEGTPLRWLGNVIPKSYSVQADACNYPRNYEKKRYNIKSYPNDKITIKFDTKNCKWMKTLLELIETGIQFIAPSFNMPSTIELKVQAEAQWAEWTDWRAFYKYDVALVIELNFGDQKAHLGHSDPSSLGGTWLPVARIPIPGVISKYVGDLGVYIKFIGAVSVEGHWARTNPDSHKAFALGKCTLGAGIVAEGRIGPKNKKAIEVTAECTATFTAQVSTPQQDGEPRLNFGLKFDGIKATFKVVLLNGWIEFSKEAVLMGERSILSNRTFNLVRDV